MHYIMIIDCQALLLGVVIFSIEKKKKVCPYEIYTLMALISSFISHISSPPRKGLWSQPKAGLHLEKHWLKSLL